MNNPQSGLSQKSGGTSKNSNQSDNKSKKVGNMSIASQSARKNLNRGLQREEIIAKQITQQFEQRESEMTKVIKATIFEDKKIYKMYRKDQDARMLELEKEKVKIKRKKNKKERTRLMRQNIVSRFHIICLVIKQTFLHYKKLYFESDSHRYAKLLEVQTGASNKMQKDDDDDEKQNRSDKSLKRSQTRSSMKSANEIFNIAKEIIEKKRAEQLENNMESTLTDKIDPESEFGKNLLKNMSQKIQLVYTGKKFIQQLQKFFDSPFKKDKQFALDYIAQLTRDRIEESEDVLNALFYPKIFNVILSNNKDTDTEMNRKSAFEILANMVQSEKQRRKLAEENYLAKVFEKAMIPSENSKGVLDESERRIIEKLSWLAALISFHEDMYDYVVPINLLEFVIRISSDSYPPLIRSNAVLAISLLTYNQNLFEALISNKVIDLIMKLCSDKNQDLAVKQFSTLALVHFALNKKSIQILIHRGVLNLFDTFSSSPDNNQQSNIVIQTNVAWIFLALCNNDITGQQMLQQGITRDMFLVSCNPNYHQIRHLVITGFAELGRSNEPIRSFDHLNTEKQRIKETATVGVYNHLQSEAQENIDILINFSCSNDLKYQYSAVRALKDYILLTHDNLIKDMSNVIQVFINGCLSHLDSIQGECANAISFLVTHHLVYQCHPIELNKIQIEFKNFNKIKEQIQNQNPELILDAIMYLSGCGSKNTRTTAFSTLSSLSKYSSQFETVMAAIERDIQLPEDQSSRQYLNFIQTRLQEKQKTFYQDYKNEEIEKKFTGLYSLLRLAQDPLEEEIHDATDKYLAFIENEYDINDVITMKNENYFIKVFRALRNSHDPTILRKLLKVIKFYVLQDDSPFQKSVIDPHTILWMLEIMEHQKSEKYLCCLTSQTLLEIVQRHEIQFDYQEVAIIKKFNLVLQNIDVFYSDQTLSDEDSSSNIQNKSNQSRDKQSSRPKNKQENEKETLIDFQNTRYISRSKTFSDENTGEISKPTDQKENFIENELKLPNQEKLLKESESNKLVTIQSVSQENEQSTRQVPISPITDEQIQKSLEASLKEIRIIQIEKQSAEESHKFQSGTSQSKLSEKEISMRQGQSVKSQSQNIKNIEDLDIDIKDGDIRQPQQENKNNKSSNNQSQIESEKRKGAQSSISSAKKDFMRQSSRKITLFNKETEGQPTLKSLKTLVLERKKMNSSIEKNNKEPRLPKNIYDKKMLKEKLLQRKSNPSSPDPQEFEQDDVQSVNTEDLEQVNLENIDPNDTETIDILLRDSLIKSFMVIFTNDQSQHLLLNKDLIDIAFNCLEYCNDCTLAAKRHVARLISIIFKFPQVQERLMAEEVVKGICQLLSCVKYLDIMRYTIKACTYISMNYQFIKQEQFSLQILKAMMDLLKLLKKDQDQINIILTIKNILKGHKENKRYFYENGGTLNFIEIALDSRDLYLIEMCVQALSEQASYKKIMIQILNSENHLEKLKKLIKKCLDITENWQADQKDEKLKKTKLINQKQLNSSIITLENSKVGRIQIGDLIQDGQGNQSERRQAQSPPLDKEDITEDSKFAYSVIDDSNIKIPEFLRNDLDQIQEQIGEEQGQIEQDFNVTKMGKIRNSIYYIIARAIKFDMETTFLLKQCFLIQKVIKDLSQQNDNNFIFQNILLIIQNLKLEKKVIVEVVGTNYETIIAQVYQTKDKDRRASLLKVLLNMILEAPDELCEVPFLYERVLGMAKDDERSDDSMIENILWFCTSLCEQCIFSQNFSLVIQNLLQNDILQIISDQFKSEEERIILQALKLLSKLADIEVCRNQLFQHEELFKQIRTISQQSPMVYKIYQIEIETTLCQCLDKITQVNQNEIQNSSVYGQRIDQIKIFNKYLIDLALIKIYKMQRIEDIMYQTFGTADILTITEQMSMQDTPASPSPPRSFEQTNVFENNQLDQLVLDDIDRIVDSNQMIENIVKTLSNISNEKAMQTELIQNGILTVIEKYLQLFFNSAQSPNRDGIDELEQGIDLSVLTIGSLNLVKAVSKLILNFTYDKDIMHLTIQMGLLPLIIQSLNKLHDYEVHTNLYMALGNFLTIGLQGNDDEDCHQLRERSNEAGLLDQLHFAYEQSQFFKIRRIAGEYLSLIYQK